MQHVYSQLRIEITSRGHNADGEQLMDSDDRFSRLSQDDLRQLFVKHRTDDLAFFCDLGELPPCAVKGV